MSILTDQQQISSDAQQLCADTAQAIEDCQTLYDNILTNYSTTEPLRAQVEAVCLDLGIAIQAQPPVGEPVTK